jgi:hypothetical protein
MPPAAHRSLSRPRMHGNGLPPTSKLAADLVIALGEDSYGRQAGPLNRGRREQAKSNQNWHYIFALATPTSAKSMGCAQAQTVDDGLKNRQSLGGWGVALGEHGDRAGSRKNGENNARQGSSGCAWIPPIGSSLLGGRLKPRRL